MKSLEDPLAEAITNMMRYPSNEDHACDFCGTLVPKFPLTLTNTKGVTKTLMIQPACKCEAQAHDDKVNSAVELKQKNDIERRFAISVLGERFAESKFETFRGREGSEKALEYAVQYANSFKDYGGDSLMIWGTPGNGKSHLSAAVCHLIKEKGFIPVFQSVPELLERIRSTFRSQNKESEKEIMDALRECDLLVMDDIGSEKLSDWVLDVLFRIIDGRYRNKKPTMFTTNFSPTELIHRFMPERPTAEQEISAKRLLDRMIEVSIVIENKASSFRMEIAKSRTISEKEKQNRMWA